MGNANISVIIAVGAGSSPEGVEASLLSLSASHGIEVIVAAPIGFSIPSSVDGPNWEFTFFDPEFEALSLGTSRAFSLTKSDAVVIIEGGVIFNYHSVALLQDLLVKRQDCFYTTQLGIIPVDEGAPKSDDSLVYSLQHKRAARSESMKFVAVPRQMFLTLRGFDHEIENLSRAITDFTHRAKRFGYFQEWDPEGVSVGVVAERLNSLNGIGKADNSSDKEVLNSTPIFRNLTSWSFASQTDPPLVSVVISTFNRGAYLSDCLYSIMAQTFQDFEVVLVDDGSTDDTEEIVGSISDPRIRYFKRENVGISASRNFGTTQARGKFIAVHDDDDLMLPWRLEKQLGAFGPGDHGCFGVSVHFDNETGSLSRLTHRKFNIQTALRYGHNPTHPTWLVRKDIFERFRYDESLKSGVDNNIALRMVRSGVKFRHTGESLILRRVHSQQITRTAGEIQRATAKMSQRLLKFTNGLASDPSSTPSADEWMPKLAEKPFEAEVRPYLPDHLMTRSVTMKSSKRTLGLETLGKSVGSLDYRIRAQKANFEFEEIAEIHDVSLEGLAVLRVSNIEHSVLITDSLKIRADESHSTKMVEDWVSSSFMEKDLDGTFRILIVCTLLNKSERMSEITGDLQGFSWSAVNRSSHVEAYLSIPLSIDQAVLRYRTILADLPSNFQVSILSVGVDALPISMNSGLVPAGLDEA